MGVRTSWWRLGWAAVVLAVATLAAGVHLTAADSEEAAAKERKPEAEKVEREREHSEGERADRETHARKLKERFEQLQRELRELRPDQDDLAEKMEREMREIRERVQSLIEPRRPEGDRVRRPEWDREPEPDRKRLMHRIEELREAMIGAREAGRHEEAGRLERHAQELMQVLRGGAKPTDAHAGEETDRRRHLRQAVEHLRAGGFHDLADRLQHEAERRMREARPDAPHPEHRDRPHPEPSHGPPAPEVERAVRELRAEVQRIQRQVEELREHVRRSGAERRDEED